MFASAMDDIVVKRYNKYREAQDSIRCRFVYAPKQRVLADLLDKAQNLQLPVVALTNGGITRDPNRVFNKLQGSYIASSDPTVAKKLLQPVPIDLTINMTILTRFQEDYDQIVTNFIPYFDPYIIISWRTPSMPDYEIRSQVLWSGNIAATYPYDINSTQVARVEGTTSFTFKGWLFNSIILYKTSKASLGDNSLGSILLQKSYISLYLSISSSFTENRFKFCDSPIKASLFDFFTSFSNFKSNWLAFLMTEAGKPAI
jgi:hypothetical protein